MKKTSPFPNRNNFLFLPDELAPLNHSFISDASCFLFIVSSNSCKLSILKIWANGSCRTLELWKDSNVQPKLSTTIQVSSLNSTTFKIWAPWLKQLSSLSFYGPLFNKQYLSLENIFCYVQFWFVFHWANANWAFTVVRFYSRECIWVILNFFSHHLHIQSCPGLSLPQRSLQHLVFLLS